MDLEPFCKFIDKHHVLTLATCCDELPWIASCFYVFDKKNLCFIIAGDKKTRHLQEALKNPQIAGNIHLETKEVGKISGLQFSGVLQKATKEDKLLYLKTYPYALALNPALWSLRVHYMKLTDNKLGFGKKLEFTKPS